MKKILIFLGPPGSGKGTQAKKIAAKHGYAHISTGDLFRALAKDENATDKQKQALEEMKSGNLVPDWLVYELAFKAIEENLKAGRGVVLDGAIRSSEQAAEYQKFFVEKKLDSDVTAVEISISDDESLNRLTKRRVCSQCGEIIPAFAKASAGKPAGVSVEKCPKCGGELVVRADDNAETVKERIEMQGNSAIEPVRAFYKNLGEYVMIDGMRTIEEVESDIDMSLRGA